MEKFLVKAKTHPQKLSSNSVARGDSSAESEEGSISLSDDEVIEEIKNAKKKNLRKYSMEWELKHKWLKFDEETKRANCVVCKQLLICQKTHIDRHANTKKHLENLKIAHSSSKMNITQFLPNKNSELQRNVSTAEMKLVLRMISCNHYFKSMDKLAKFNATIYPDSVVAKSVSCSRTKSKAISQFLGKEGLLQMVEKMKKQSFSLIIDETTDISTEKCLVLVVRQFDGCKGKTVDRFFRLLQPSDGSGESICNSILSSLEENQIPLKNFIGLATDNASTIVGRNNGVATLLKKNIPQLFHIGCVCHSINLVNNSSLSCIPDDVEQLLRNIFKYFKSAKRQYNFKELQGIFDVPEHKILRLCDTRWLSFESVATRILEQWSVLHHFFIRAQFEEKSASNLQKIRVILDALSPVNKTYLKFLTYILRTMNKFNRNFQSESSQIIYLVSSTKDILLELYKNFLKKEYINKTELEKIDFNNVLHIKDISSIYFGHEAEPELLCTENFSKICIIEIKSKLLSFYQKLCMELITRIDIKNKKLNVLKYLDPLYIVSNEDINYFELVSEFKDLITDPDAFINELKLLESKINDTNYENIFKILNAEDFWREIGTLKNRFNEYIYPNLYKLVSHIFTLPHSSASAERVFSKLALIKNKVTNRLKVNTCESMLLSLNLLDTSPENWVPSEELLRKYRNRFKNNSS